MMLIYKGVSSGAEMTSLGGRVRTDTVLGAQRVRPDTLSSA
jgi:hypothetical protein